MLTQDITIHLSKFSWLDVIDNLMLRSFSGTNAAFAEIASTLHADFVLAGTVRERNHCFRVSVQLTGTDNQRILWAEQYDGKLDSERIYPHDAIVHRVVATLGDTMGVLAQIMRTRARRKRGEVMSVIEAVLTSLDFTAQLSQSAYEKALRTARLAVQEHDDLALVWANLGARRVEAVGGLVRSGDGSAEEETLFCLNRALRIDPTCVYALWNLSLCHMFCGRLDDALKWAGRALDEEPKSPLDLAGISCALSSAGRIDDGDAFVKRAVELSPRLPGWIHWVTVYGHLLRGDETQALAATENFSLPQSFWDPLFRATVYTVVGEPKRAVAEARRAVRLRPELQERPHELVGRIIHDRELQAMTLDALRAAASRTRD